MPQSLNTVAWIALVALACSTGRADDKGGPPSASAKPNPSGEVRKVLAGFCADCHGGGSREGGVDLDKLLTNYDAAKGQATWLAVWRNLRAQTMPPADEKQPSESDRATVIRWIEKDVFKLDPANPDPGRVTIRRLNRVEYRYTIKDLFGVDFDTTDAFPADDTGYGFDTVGDVLTVSPLLIEKYLQAAEAIIAQVVPPQGPSYPQKSLDVNAFKSTTKSYRNPAKLQFSETSSLKQKVKLPTTGKYQITYEMRASGSDEATSNTAELTMAVDDEKKTKELGWDANNTVSLMIETKLEAGEHTLYLDLKPLDPPGQDEDKLYFNLRRATIRGPIDGGEKVYPKEFERVFFDGAPPGEPKAKVVYFRKILRHFGDRAFRRPIDEPTLDRIVALATATSGPTKPSFEQAVARGLTLILVSPRFLFRAEVQPDPDKPGRIVPLDEYALASRLSYFLWSSCPDDTLWDLASQKQLRANLHEQVDRMLADPKSERFVESFVGQWLLTRDVEGLPVDAKKILRLDGDAANKLFNRNVRQAMREETEMAFAYLLAENRSVLELLTADYSFLNEPLAKFYGISGVKGDQMRKVSLDKNSHRGGLLTHGSVLLVTSNPTRTSPVKRGLFVLENLLGTPPPPPPPDVPPLDDIANKQGKRPTLRELLEVHRKDPMCASCHARMDPIGLSLEEFNVLGLWRDNDSGKKIETAGQLITGEKFKDVRDLERVIATKRHRDFYRCLSEKLLTYALGRGIEHYDAPTIDHIVEALDKNDGRLRTLVYEIVDSAPFQKRRGDGK